MSTSMKDDVVESEAEQLLKCLDWAEPNYDENGNEIRCDGPWHLATIDPIKGGAPRVTVAADASGVRAFLAENAGKSNCYFHVASIDPSVRKKAKETDVLFTRALCLDVDPMGGEKFEPSRAAILEAMQNPPEGIPRPSIIVDSGNGLQCYWLLTIPYFVNCKAEKIAYVKDRNRGIVHAFSQLESFKRLGIKSDTCVSVEHLMRLPGAPNILTKDKRERKGYPLGDRLARIIVFEPGRTYSIEQFERHASNEVADLDESFVKVEIDWDAANALVNTFTLEGLRARGVSDYAVDLLDKGDHEGRYKGDRNRMALSVAGLLYRAGLSPDETAAVLATKTFPGNAHFNKMDKDNPRRRAIGRTINEARKKVIVTAQRAARNEPLWRDYDKERSRPVASLENAEIAIKALGVTCRLDLFHHAIMMALAGKSESTSLIGDNQDYAISLLRGMINKKWRIDFGDKTVWDAIIQIALANFFDPVLDYLDGLKWDGVPRLDRAAVDYFNAEDTPLNREMIKVTLLASVRRARHAGCKFDTIMVLESKEGFSKSSAIECLYGKDNFSDQTILGISDKEVQEQLRGVWGHECADLAGMGKAEAQRVKAFATRTTDRARPAYGRGMVKQKRRGVLWATTNAFEYLQSADGNRRFWPMAVLREIDMDKLRHDRDQLWAEAAEREADLPPPESGYVLNIPRSMWPEATAAQEERRERDPWEDTLANIPDKARASANDNGKSITVVHRLRQGRAGVGYREQIRSADLLTFVLSIPPAGQTRLHTTRLATVMRRLGWTKSKGDLRFPDGSEARGYWRGGPEVNGKQEVLTLDQPGGDGRVE